MSGRGRKPNTPTELVKVELNHEALRGAGTAMDAVSTLGAAVTDAQVEFGQEVGGFLARRATRDVITKLLTVTEILDLIRFKESKSYRHQKISIDGKVVTVTTWEEFCTLVVGRSREQVDEDIRNLKAFGAEFFDATQRMGVGYRELRAMRTLDADLRTELIEAAKSGDKAVMLDVAEALMDRQAKEVAAKQQELEEAKQTAEARQRLIDEGQQREEKLIAKSKFKPSPDGIARNARESAQLKTLNDFGAIADLAIMDLVTVADELMTEYADVDHRLAKHARDCLEFMLKRFGNFAHTHNIRIDVNAVLEVDAPWTQHMLANNPALKEAIEKHKAKGETPSGKPGGKPSSKR